MICRYRSGMNRQVSLSQGSCAHQSRAEKAYAPADSSQPPNLVQPLIFKVGRRKAALVADPPTSQPFSKKSSHTHTRPRVYATATALFFFYSNQKEVSEVRRLARPTLKRVTAVQPFAQPFLVLRRLVE